MKHWAAGLVRGSAGSKQLLSLFISQPLQPDFEIWPPHILVTSFPFLPALIDHPCLLSFKNPSLLPRGYWAYYKLKTVWRTLPFFLLAASKLMSVWWNVNVPTCIYSRWLRRMTASNPLLMATTTWWTFWICRSPPRGPTESTPT